MIKFTLLTEEQIFGENRLNIIKKYGTKCAITDFAILLGGYVSSTFYVENGQSERDRTGWWWTKTPYEGQARAVDCDGDSTWNDTHFARVGLAQL